MSFDDDDDFDALYAEEMALMREMDKKEKASSSCAVPPPQKDLSYEQQLCSETLQRLLDDGRGGYIFLVGQAGSGKTHWIDYERRKRNNMVVTAMSGTAADNVRGITFHSYLMCGLAKDTVPVLLGKLRCRVKRTLPNGEQVYGRKSDRFRETEVLVIDEFSMMDGQLFEKFEAIRQAFNSKMVVVVVFDPFQALPVPENGAKDPFFVHETETYKRLCDDHLITRVEFKLNHRQQARSEYVDVLSRIRVGKVTPEDDAFLAKRTEWMQHLSPEERRKQYPMPPPLANGIIPTQLYTNNKQVDEVNQEYLSKLDASTRHVYHRTTTRTPTSTEDDQRVIEASARNSSLKECVELRERAQVMLLHNINKAEGLCNGSRGVVIGFDPDTDYPIVCFLKGAIRTIKPIDREVMNEAGQKIGVLRQVPLNLAWALTADKAQGATLDAVVASLDSAYTRHHIAYVILSRCVYEGLYLRSWNKRCVRVHPSIQEHYKEIVDAA